MWILWIHDPFLDMPKKLKIPSWIRKSGFVFGNPFSDSETRIWIFQKKTHPNIHGSSNGVSY